MGKKKPRNTKMVGKKQAHAEPQVKDDGYLYKVISDETNRPVYLGNGVQLGIAERLSENLLYLTYLERVQ